MTFPLKMKITSISSFVLLCLLAGCTTYTVPKTSMISQLQEHQQISQQTHFSPFSITNYPSNNLKRIQCVDKHGRQVWLYPDKNTEFRITRKSDGKKIRAYFDTLIFSEDTLYGLRSRIAGGVRVIPVNDIEKIEVHAEFPKTEKAE